MNYHLGAGRTVDCELAWSPDSREWHRILPGRAFIPLGPEGSYDSKCIYAQANPPIIGDDGRLMIYYGGDDFEHRGWVRSCLLSLATVRRDGFAGWHPQDAEKAAGSITTHPLEITGAASICADVAAGGSVRVTVLDAAGKEIEGLRHTENFDAGINGWNAYEKIEHVASGGVSGGPFVRALRAKKGNPYLSSYPTSSDGVFAGDLAKRYGAW